jgi:hypothetical protein
MEILAQDLTFTNMFLLHLRYLDVDSGSTVPQQPALEGITSNIIRCINKTITH